MRKVSPGNLTDLDSVKRKVKELCDASQQVTEEIGDAYTVNTPSGFVPVRTLNVATATATDVANVLATFLLDLKQRGAGRRTSSV